MSFAMKDGTSFEGFLIDANQDSVVCLDSDSLSRSLSTRDIKDIQHRSNTVPVVMGGIVGFCALGFLGTFGSGGGMSGPEPIDAAKVVGFGLSGAFLGMILGNFIDLTDTYEISAVSFQVKPDSPTHRP